MEPVITIKRNGLTEKQALTLEIILIAKIGRRDQNLGPLTNLTHGGDRGSTDFKHTDEMKSKSREGWQKWYDSLSTKEKQARLKRLQEGKSNISKASEKRRVAKRLETLTNKTAEEKQLIRDKKVRTMLSRTAEEKLKSKLKKQNTWANRSEKEKALTTKRKSKAATIDWALRRGEAYA